MVFKWAGRRHGICLGCTDDSQRSEPMQIRPRRSVLYMPGSNIRALDKAKSLPADALILDLEDAVAPEAKEAARLACLVMGTNDLVKETRADLSLNRRPALYWLSATVTAARAFGLDVLDGVYNNFGDADGLRRECVHGRRLGFDGKTLIHPTQ